MTRRNGSTPHNRLLLLLGSFLLLAPFDAVGQEVTAQRFYEVLKSKQLADGGAYAKVSPLLRSVMDQMKARGITRLNAQERGAAALSTPLVKVNAKGAIQVYIHVEPVGDAAISVLETYKVTIEIVNEELGIIQAWIPFDRIDEVAGLPFVKRITPPSYGIPRTGSVNTEGDAILNADALRALGFDGDGVKVGVISDGVDNRASAQATGDLPANITIVTHAGSGDEGTALLEIVHDLAPGADLGFCGLSTSLQMIQCVNDLAGVFGADVIVDDVGFPGEPYFGDGPIAQAVAKVAGNPVYVSAAGNDAQVHYEDDFVGTTVLGLGVPEHNFGNAAGGASDPTMNILVAPNATIIVVLQWNDPFGGSANDYDLLLVDETETFLLALSEDVQNGNDDPIEAIVFTNPFSTASIRVKVVIAQFSGANRRLEMFTLLGPVLVEEFNVPDGSVFGHPAVSGVLATAAIAASDPGNDTIESFSSRGPSEIFFPIRETRQTPTVAAIDGVSVTGAGGFPSLFFGTSASAPHVAGVAALLKQGFTTTAEIVDALKNSAVDLGDPGTDTTFGAGRIDALAAAQQLNDPPNSTIDTPTGDVTITAGEPVNFTGTCTDPNSTVSMSFRWAFGAGSGIADATVEDPGNVVFPNPGTFSVSFTCTDGFGQADPSPDTRTATVVNLPPDGVINTPSGNVTITQGESVDFTGTGTDPDGHLPLSFLWNFDGGAANSTQEDPGSVTFNTPGVFNVTLTVTDSLGAADPTPPGRSVTVAANTPPDGTIDTPTGNVTITLGDSLEFTGTGTDPDGHLPLRFLWNFGGGAPNSTQEDPGLVKFDIGGTFTVAFTVTDDLNMADPTPATRTITVDTPAGQFGKSGGDKCFIATAAYGSALEPEVKILREFRDRLLLPTPPGRAFVKWYYRTSPPYAAVIAEHPRLRQAVRLTLWPLVYSAKGLLWVSAHPLAGFMLVFVFGGLRSSVRRRPCKSRTSTSGWVAQTHSGSPSNAPNTQ